MVERKWAGFPWGEVHDAVRSFGGAAREQGAKAFSGTWDSPTAEAPQEADFGSGSGRADPANPCLRAAVPRQRGCSGRRVLSGRWPCPGALAPRAQMVSLPPTPTWSLLLPPEGRVSPRGPSLPRPGAWTSGRSPDRRLTSQRPTTRPARTRSPPVAKVCSRSCNFLLFASEFTELR